MLEDMIYLDLHQEMDTKNSQHLSRYLDTTRQGFPQTKDESTSTSKTTMDILQ